jgi:glycosyltransferase involved in cell wall biosynthesis
MKMRYKYSVVIPHYNSSSELIRLLESIPEREDIQIIVVDDFSSANHVEFLKRNLQQSTKLSIYFSCKKLTAGGARNIGMDNAEGKWLLFADSDDYYEPGAFDNLDAAINSTDSDMDIYYFLARDFSDSSKVKRHRGENNNKMLLNYNEFTKFDVVVPWNKLIKANLVRRHKLKFQEVPYSNDLLFAAKLSMYAKNIEVIKKFVYCVNDCAKSLTKKIDEDSAYKRRSVQLNHEIFLFQNLPNKFKEKRKYTFYRKYLRDNLEFNSSRLNELLYRYEDVSGIKRKTLFKYYYHTYLAIKKVLLKLGFPHSLLWDGPGSKF